MSAPSPTWKPMWRGGVEFWAQGSPLEQDKVSEGWEGLGNGNGC